MLTRRRTAMTAWISAIAVVLLALSACTSHSKKKDDPTVVTTTPTTTGPPPPPVYAPPIQFSDCTAQIASGLPRNQADRVSRLSFGCGHLQVPLDYADPYGPSTSLYVVRVHDNNQSKYQGSLVVNPGGPGASGVQLATSLALDVSLDVLDNFDIVGFDPRGVFLSSPVQCITNAQKDQITSTSLDVRTPAGSAQARALYAPIGPECAAKYPQTLGDFNTDFTARDLDLVRQGMSDKKLNYLGFSYGTRLGAVYAHLFPDYVRTMVLDGAVDPVATELASDESQIAGFETAFDEFAADCATRDDCKPIGPARAAVTALATAADATPIPTSRAGDTRTATGAIVRLAVSSALYNQSSWPQLASAIIKAQKGDASGLFELTDSYNQRNDDGTYSNLIDANTTISCNDSTLSLTDADIEATAASWAVKYPLFGLYQAANLYTCSSWPGARTAIPPATAPTAAPILVIGTVHDPATPYAAAGVLAQTLGSGVLLTWDGEGHTAYPRTTCVRNAVDTYLIDAKPPAAKTTCPAK